ncbi:MAG TPA: TonB-dependent receptor, partial [Acidobacteriota bacterium]|nr:TonB-dependent receptor [Acidobacteriota bacterium]
MPKALLLLIALITSVSPVIAEDDEAPLLMLEEEYPAAGADVTVLTREQIERSQTPFVLDLLRTVPGLLVIQTGGPGKTALVFARGSQATQVLILIDGTPVNGGILPIDLAHLTTTNVERIEIERGPQGAVAGSSAVGAVIRIITGHSGPIISARGEYGSNTTRRFGIRSGAGSDANHYAIAFERYDTDGESPNADYRNDTLSAQAKVMITQWTSAGLQYHDADTEGGSPTPIKPDTPPLRRKTRSRLLSVPFQQEIARWASLEAQYSTLQQEFNSVSSRTNTILINGHFKPTQAHDLIAGYEHDDLKTTLSVDGEEQKITNDAVFAEYRWMGSPGLQTSIAVRMDHDSGNGSRFSPRLTASYQANGYLRIHGSAGTGYRRPEPEEVRFIEIKRERAEGLDFGADLVPSKRISVSAVFFHTLYSDTIVNPGFFGPRNLPAYTATGVELDAGTQIAEGLKIRGTYTLTH